MLQVLRFGCSYEAIADTTCSATTIRNRRDEWIELGVFAQLKTIVLDAYDRIVGLILEKIAVGECITKAPGGGQVAGRSPVGRGKQGIKRSSMVDGRDIPLDRVLAGANRHDSPLLAPTLVGEIAHKGDKAPIQAGQRWHVERTNAWHNAFNRLQRCYERTARVIDAFFDLADAIITLRSLIRQAWTSYRWDTRPAKRP